MHKKLVLETTAPFQGLPELVAYDEGLFEREGLKIEWADREKGVEKKTDTAITSQKGLDPFSSHGRLLEQAARRFDADGMVGEAELPVLERRQFAYLAFRKDVILNARRDSINGLRPSLHLHGRRFGRRLRLSVRADFSRHRKPNQNWNESLAHQNTGPMLKENWKCGRRKN